MELFTSSRARSFRACQRQHYLHYVMGYCTVASRAPLRFGTAFHVCIEQYWLCGTDAAVARSQKAFDESLDPYDTAKLRAMVYAYCLGWDVRRVGYIERVLGVEREYKLPMINPLTGRASRTWERAGKVDVIVLLCDGRLAVIEHKTSAEPAAPASGPLAPLSALRPTSLL